MSLLLGSLLLSLSLFYFDVKTKNLTSTMFSKVLLPVHDIFTNRRPNSVKRAQEVPEAESRGSFMQEVKL